MSEMVCPECGEKSYYVVDGKEMPEYVMLHLSFPPRSIERRLDHALWCSIAHREFMMAGQESDGSESDE